MLNYLMVLTLLKSVPCLREVIKANGVGPKLGLGILLSGMTASQFVQSVEREDISNIG